MPMQNKSCIVAERFKGPPNSGNGGYAAGLLAKELKGDVKVMLRRPPPLDTPMSIKIGGASAELYDQEDLVASAEQTVLELNVPPCPTRAQITTAAPLFEGAIEHVQPVCFVCGTERGTGDGLRIFAAPIDGEPPCVAGYWSPDESLADEDGLVAVEFVWAALDCPGYFAHRTGNMLLVTGTMTASIMRRPKIGQSMISMGWHIEQNGRKYISGTALFDEDNQLYAKSHQVWIAI